MKLWLVASLLSLISTALARPALVISDDRRGLIYMGSFGFLAGGTFDMALTDLKISIGEGDIGEEDRIGFLIQKGSVQAANSFEWECDCILDDLFFKDEIARDPSLKTTEINPGLSYLSAGDIPLPKVYGASAIAYLAAGSVWASILMKKDTRVFWPHKLILILAIMIGIQKAFQTIKIHYMQTGSNSKGWTVMFYIFAFLKGSLSILIITLIASGWMFIKPFLNEKDKKIILVIIPLQTQIFPMVNLISFAVILGVIVQTQRHLSEAAEANGKTAENKSKWKFRPYANNTYILVEEDDLDREDIEAGISGSDVVGPDHERVFCSASQSDDAGTVKVLQLVALKIPDYFIYIKHPMDLSTAEKKLNNVEYEAVDDLTHDIQLIVDNCQLYNGKESEISQRAVALQKAFLLSMRNMPKDNPKPAFEPVEFREPAKKAPPAAKTKKDSSKKEPRKEPMITPIELVTPGATLASSASIPSYPNHHARAESEERRPKRDTHAPSKEISTGTSTKKKGGSRWKTNEQLRFCLTVLKEFSKKSKAEFMFPFMEPVDPIKLNIPEYPLIIKHPMDLSTIRQKLEGDEYDDASQFEADVRLVISNCYAFNPPGSQVHIMGQRMEKLFNEKWAERPAPPTPPMETVDVDSEEMDDYSSDDKIAEMERHLKTLSDKLESMKADKKKDKHGKKSKSSSKHSKARSEVSAPTSTSSEKKKHKRSRQVISSSEDEDDMDVVRVKEKAPLITLDQQKELSNTINNFTGQELADVIQIIHDSMPHLKNGGQDEIELDMDSLDPTTLYRLYEYVSQNRVKPRKPALPKIHKAHRPDEFSRKSSDQKPKGQEAVQFKRLFGIRERSFGYRTRFEISLITLSGPTSKVKVTHAASSPFTLSPSSATNQGAGTNTRQKKVGENQHQRQLSTTSQQKGQAGNTMAVPTVLGT
ncbi:hypothetical protein BG006_001025 [Podila minutissima]|uniref:Bromodomain-containing protein n=1 Tax=Podila minutissima TaxID=64525 RepID=A0A9P5SP40_9FUNG|nr:hypothetical protein BG006_001025 [Podila minutissima]